MKYPIIKSAFLIFLSYIVFTEQANSQPKVQQGSIWAPANIKIDGKTAEWNNKFQAYNKAINIFYTIANDDKNLYLVLQATDQNIIYKIINGGIIVTINNTGKKNTANDVKISYPIFGIKNLPMINLRDKPVPVKTAANNVARVDSFRNSLNVQLENNSKNIKVSGVSSIPDSLISVYNDLGIQPAERFDNQLAYTYELAFPIKYLKSAGIDPAHIYYNIKVRGRLSGLPMNRQPTLIVAGPGDEVALYDTDFWGEYTFSKK